MVCGSTTGSVAIDAAGLAPSGRLPVTGARIAGVLLAIAATVIGAIGARGALEPLLLGLALLGGAGMSMQSAANGRLGRATGEPFVASFTNSSLGLAALAIVAAITLATHDVGALPANPALYLGGLLGAFVVVVSLTAVQTLGVLRLGLATVAGQTAGALVIDLAAPAPGEVVTAGTVIGVRADARRRRGQRPRPPRPLSARPVRAHGYGLAVLELRVYGESGALADAGRELERDGRVRHVALAPALDAGSGVLTGVVQPDAADIVLRRLAERGIAPRDMSISRSDDIGLGSAGPQAALIWADVLGQAGRYARLVGRYLVFMVAAGVIAGFGVIELNQILIVGAMAVSPDALPIAATAIGIVAGRGRARRARTGHPDARAVRGGDGRVRREPRARPHRRAAASTSRSARPRSPASRRSTRRRSAWPWPRGWPGCWPSRRARAPASASRSR